MSETQIQTETLIHVLLKVALLIGLMFALWLVYKNLIS